MQFLNTEFLSGDLIQNKNLSWGPYPVLGFYNPVHPEEYLSPDAMQMNQKLDIWNLSETGDIKKVSNECYWRLKKVWKCK